MASFSNRVCEEYTRTGMCSRRSCHRLHPRRSRSIPPDSPQIPVKFKERYHSESRCHHNFIFRREIRQMVCTECGQMRDRRSRKRPAAPSMAEQANALRPYEFYSTKKVSKRGHRLYVMKYADGEVKYVFSKNPVAKPDPGSNSDSYSEA